MQNSTHKKGKNAEKLAEEYLKKKGWKILATNYKSLNAEIDIIALDKKELVIIEVKSGKASHFELSQSVNYKKRKKIENAAKTFIYSRGYINSPIRFEIITVNTPTGYIHHFQEEFFDG